MIIVVSVIAAVVVVSLAVAAYFLLSSSDVESLPKDVDAKTTAHSRELTVGNCLLSLPTGESIAEVTVVPCADAHDAQVVAAKKFSGEKFPGDAKVIEQTTAICPGKSITSDTAPEALDFLVWTPSEDSWGEGDRKGLCIAASPDGKLTGSLLG
ncbi:Septum formation [Sanguibacter gelidistatuariae]|uniref:Septum formation n=1 Tax=Sanguibacter gelidistatuariae TaxID=1814289 RepID=A0A1G6HBU9_9MICO|nr:septum formation family protein [Sanguibacter gelidistatuariae]SDB91752.1 Septum formation [Sanguibacter gelidistatuariae]